MFGLCLTVFIRLLNAWVSVLPWKSDIAIVIDIDLCNKAIAFVLFLPFDVELSDTVTRVDTRQTGSCFAPTGANRTIGMGCHCPVFGTAVTITITI